MRQLSCILIALAIAAVYGNKQDKLINGMSAEIGNCPYCVSIRINNNHFCGGSIIDKQYILTAADCVFLIQFYGLKESWTVITGITNLNLGGDTYKVAQTWSHDYYNPYYPRDRRPHNIGLIMLTSPIRFGPTQLPIELPKRDIAVNDDLTTAVWDFIGWTNPLLNNLQKLNAKVIFADKCQLHQNFKPVDKYEFCTSIINGTTLCYGDIGNGLIQNSDRTIAGLVTRGSTLSSLMCQKIPEIFTAVNPYVPWIRQKMSL